MRSAGVSGSVRRRSSRIFDGSSSGSTSPRAPSGKAGSRSRREPRRTLAPVPHSHSAAGRHTGNLAGALAIGIALLVVEVAAGIAANSLALLADAGHVFADVSGTALSLVAIRVAARPPSGGRTFGLYRLEMLAAAVNAVLLLGIAVVVLVEAVRRFAAPPDVQPSLVIVVAAWHGADALASVVVAGLIVPRTVRLLRDSVDVLLEATPKGVELREVERHIREAPGVVDVHDLHAWTITSGMNVVSAHVVLGPDGRPGDVLDHLGTCLAADFDINHSTFQLETPEHVLWEARADQARH